MKKFKYLFLLLVVVFLVPLFAFAEGEEEEGTLIAADNRVAVYFFHGDGCPHCAEAETWFESIEEEYGSKYRIVAYEVWNNEDNAKLMQQVAELRGDDASGVPYIIIGDKSWIGFSENSMGSEIKAQIDSLYEVDPAERYDILNYVKTGTVPEKETDSSSHDVLALIIILVVVAGVGFGIYKARETTNA